ncbi:hypothetical protein JVT61DRAFT_11041 [Boletus reticuloceps]|uniref:Uncharacterized protein n=1 Tax=Boletus reticuloceps TaxID=495285 RepID=A0A8I2YF80_9AGAM|nr:hypothetical protein JVT61DRAFT_11041 [Boletus reticuloceps]
MCISAAVTVLQGRDSARPGVCGPNLADIRRSTIAAQSRASVNPPPVRAISHVASLSSLMPPPSSLPVHRHNISARSSNGPDIHVPSPRGRSTSFPSQSATSPSAAPLPSAALPPYPHSVSYGYGPQHAQYGPSHALYAELARRPPEEVYALDILAVYECTAGSKKNTKNNIIGSIREGVKDVDALSDADSLVALALSVVIPRLQTFGPDFCWRTDEFVVRDAKWVNLLSNGTWHYFYHDCLQRNTRKGAARLMFKLGKQFTLFVVVPETQWEEFEDFRAKQNVVAGPSSLTHSPSRAQSRKPQHQGLILRLSAPSTTSSSNFDTPLSHHIQVNPQPAIIAPSPSMPTPEDDPPKALVPASAKRSHNHTRSIASASAQSPPPKKRTPVGYTSPDRNQLQEALLVGGATDFNAKKGLFVQNHRILNYTNIVSVSVLGQKVEQIVFYPIPVRDLSELEGKDAAFRTDHDLEDQESGSGSGQRHIEMFSGTLRSSLALDSIIGVGGFKLAQIAQLMLTPLRPFGLGSQANHEIVIKRPFVPQDTPVPKPPYERFTFEDEGKMLYRESNVLYWAHSLMKLTYDFIDHRIHSAPSPPPFDVPRLRFVEAGLVLLMQIPVLVDRS